MLVLVVMLLYAERSTCGFRRGVWSGGGRGAGIHEALKDGFQTGRGFPVIVVFRMILVVWRGGSSQPFCALFDSPQSSVGGCLFRETVVTVVFEGRSEGD